jgi:hypothetical protein
MGSHHAKAVCASLGLLLLVIAALGCEESPTGMTEEATGMTEEAASSLVMAGKDNGGGGRLDHRAICNLRNRFTLEIDNEFLPMPIGRRWVLEGEEDGEALRVQITVLNRVEVVGGVRTRVVEEREWTGPNFDELELIERSLNYYAQVDEGRHEGTVCYFGEEVFPASIGGEWRADAPNSHAGIFMPADPEVGMIYLQEDAPTARDLAGHVGEDKKVRVPYGTFRETILVRDCNTIEEPGCNPLKGDGSLKIYAEDFGFIADGPAELVRFRPGAAFSDDGDEDEDEDRNDREDDREEDDDESRDRNDREDDRSED